MPTQPVNSPLTDGSLPYLYDVAIDGVGYLVAWEIDRELLSPWKTAYLLEEADLLLERTDTSVAANDMTENKLDLLFWDSQRSWDYGAGQQRFDVQTSTFPPDRAFLSSMGIDVFSVPGQATLLPSTSNILALTNSTPTAPQKMVACQNGVFVAAGQPNIKRFTLLDGSDVSTLNSGTSTSQQVFDLSTDGLNVYAALGPDGITENAGTTFTQIDALNATTGWSAGSGVTLGTDSSDYETGGASLTMVTTSGGPNTATKTVSGAPLNLTSKTPFTIWHKQGVPSSQTFMSGGSYVVPAGITNITVTGLGGVGGSRTASGGNGAQVVATIPVTPGHTLTITFNGGGNADNSSLGGAGGGNGAFLQDGSTLLLAAGGGGGAASNGLNQSGGAAGAGGAGGQTGSSGGNGTGGNQPGFGGGGATQSGGGISQQGPNGTGPGPGTTPQGGAASDGGGQGGGGGAGGGGYYGGGAGSTAGSSFSPGGGGGGGSSFVINTATGVSYTSGANAGAPSLTITPVASAQPVAFEMVTSGGNFYTSPQFTPMATNTWNKYTFSQSQFTATGSPSWANINQVVLVTEANPEVGAITYKWNDLEYGTPNSFTSFNTTDARVLGWAKDQLFAAGIATGTTWQFFAAANGSQKIWYTLPAGYTVSAISELGGYVYFSAFLNTQGYIYGFDGTNAPFRACALPPGEQPLSLIPFLGAGLLVGARRTGTHGNLVGQGVIYRAFPNSDGTLTLEQVTTIGQDDGSDYGPEAGCSFQNKVYFEYAKGDSTHTGLGVYYPTTGGYTRHLEAVNQQNHVVSVAVYQGRVLFTVEGVGVFAQQATFLPSGQLISSVMDWNIDKQKLVLDSELGTLALPAGTSVSLDWSTDGGVTWQNLQNANAPGSFYSEAPVRAQAFNAQTRVTLNSDNTNTLTPVLKKTGLGAIYGFKPTRVWQVAIKAYSYMNLKNGTQHPQSGPKLSATIESTLTTLRDNQSIVWFQPSGYGEENTTQVPVRIQQIRVLRQMVHQVGWGNVVQVTLKEVP